MAVFNISETRCAGGNPASDSKTALPKLAKNS